MTEINGISRGPALGLGKELSSRMLYADRETRLEEQRLWYRNNLEQFGNAPRREAKRTLVRSVMHIRPCADCGLAYPGYVMTLDDGSGQKVDTLKRLANRKASVETILAEIRRCDRVCLNCRAAREFPGRLTPAKPSPSLRKTRRVC